MIPWAFTGCELVRDVYPEAGGHADHWETSLLQALKPGLTNLSELPTDRSAQPVAVISKKPVQEASAEFGAKAIRLIVARVTTQVKDRLDNPNAYYAHGWRA